MNNYITELVTSGDPTNLVPLVRELRVAYDLGLRTAKEAAEALLRDKDLSVLDRVAEGDLSFVSWDSTPEPPRPVIPAGYFVTAEQAAFLLELVDRFHTYGCLECFMDNVDAQRVRDMFPKRQ